MHRVCREEQVSHVTGQSEGQRAAFLAPLGECVVPGDACPISWKEIKLTYKTQADTLSFFFLHYWLQIVQWLRVCMHFT